MSENCQRTKTPHMSAMFKIKAFIAYCVFVFANFFFLLFAIFIAPIALFSTKTWRKLALWELRHSLYFYVFKILPFMGIYDINAHEAVESLKLILNSNKNKNYILTPNHTSWLDPFLVLALVPNAVVVVKKKYVVLPSIYFLVKFCGFIAIDESSQSLQDSMQKLNKEIINGWNVVIFPEGKRSDIRRLGEFGRMAFKASRDTNTTVIPVMIRSKQPFLTKQTGLSAEVGNVFTMRFLGLLNPEDFRTASDISDATYTLISRVLRGRDFQ